MENKEKVAILMATYNGERYLKEQIESILNQTYKEFVIYIRDDNSTDSTKEIIKDYAQKFPDRIIYVEDEKNAKGAWKNFMYLLEYVHNTNMHDLFMFCDQDDFWLKEKISDTIKEYENVKDKNKPILIHTDLEVVDHKLNTIKKSFIKFCRLKTACNKLNNYLIQNNVTGSTILINKSLVNLVKFDIQNIRMHDWYFALIASAFGEIIFINKATIKYRQHENNVIGAKKIKGVEAIRNNLSNLFIQAESFKKFHYQLLDEKNKKIIDSFIAIKEKHKLIKIKTIMKYKFLKQDIISIIGEIVFI